MSVNIFHFTVTADNEIEAQKKVHHICEDVLSNPDS